MLHNAVGVIWCIAEGELDILKSNDNKEGGMTVGTQGGFDSYKGKQVVFDDGSLWETPLWRATWRLPLVHRRPIRFFGGLLPTPLRVLKDRSKK